MAAKERLAANRAALATKLQARATATTAIESLRGKVESDPASVTDAEITTAIEARSAIDAEIDALEEAANQLRAEISRDEAMERLAGDVIPTNPGRAPPANDRSHNARPGEGVRSEPLTYTEHSSLRDKHSWFQDAFRVQTGFGDSTSRQRLERHAREVETDRPEAAERASSTGSYAGMVVPQYLTDMVAPVLRNGRPYANSINRHQLPDRGMSLIIPRGTTGASTAVQATENTAVSSTDEVLTNLTVPVVTIAGQQDMSRQALERGEVLDQFVYSDLARAYGANLGSQVINGTGTSGQHLGMLSTAGISAATAFGAAVTVTNFNLKVAGQTTAVMSAGSGLQATAIVMTPRRWGWLQGQVDSTGRPIVVANAIGNFNALSLITAPGADSGDPTQDPAQWQYVGRYANGLPIIADLNMPAAVGAATGGEDIVAVIDQVEHHLWEEGDGTPTELRFEQTTGGSLTTKLVVYAYSAYTAGRYPQATGKIGGLDTTTNGLVAPAF